MCSLTSIPAQGALALTNYIMSNAEEIYDEEGNLVTQEATDTIDYKAELEKEKKEREKYETYFKSTAKELNEIKAKSKSQQGEDFDED